MPTIKEIQPRQNIESSWQWDLTTIFKTDEDWQVAHDAVMADLKVASAYQGTLHQGSAQVRSALAAILKVSQMMERVYVYAHLKHDQDTSVPEYIQMVGQASTMATKVSSELSWFEPEVLQLASEIAAELRTDEAYGHYFTNLLDKKEHVLNPEGEALLAQAGEVFSASERTFDFLNDTDLKFASVTTKNGKAIKVSHGSFGILLEDSDRTVREQAFHNVYAAYRSVENTMAAIMSGNVKQHNFEAKVHHYEDARAHAMASDHIPSAVYETLVDTVNESLPLLHEYVALRKEILGVDALYPYDLYTPLVGEAPLRFTYEEAKAVTFEALKPLGEDYLTQLARAFDERWIDVYENEGKTSGAYSSGSYDTNPFVLLNWQDSLDDLYTLVHELGHSMHSHYSHTNQPYVYGDYPIFLAEIASTTNENILTTYLLNHYTDKDIQIYLLTHYLDAVKGTIFRQTQFAEFEQLMHEADQKGQVLSASYLNEQYFQMNQKYYGPALASDDRTIELEWSRIPHFYYDYYVYQYATGFSAANTLAERVTSGDPDKVAAYLNYLKSGSSDFPIDTMKRAGVDMTSADYIKRTMKTFQTRLAQLKELLAQ
ncbi:MAG: oligoendopeptidase F [Aerococcus sp.]|nr:oligoendopeptidase F [Aerococcus sp.]